jgi:hypothetical protein
MLTLSDSAGESAGESLLTVFVLCSEVLDVSMAYQRMAVKRGIV